MLHQLLGPGQLRLLLESSQGIGLKAADDLASGNVRDQVAVLRGWPVDLDPERDQGVVDAERAGRQPLARVTQHHAEQIGPFDSLVGRQDEHDLVVRSIDGQGGQGDGGRGVPPERLHQDSDAGELGPDETLVASVGDDRYIVGHPGQPGDSRLDERLRGDQGQERLRVLGAAQGMEARPAAAGQDDGIHVATILGAAPGRQKLGDGRDRDRALKGR